MPPITNVAPGDLITAAYMNQLIDKLNDLETRLAALEGSTTGVKIFSITSTSSPIRVSNRISVNGSGFAEPAALNTVTVGNKTLDSGAFTFNSDDEHLLFDVPEITGLDESGTMVNVSVTNANGSATSQFLLRPKEAVPTGNLQVFYSSAPVLVHPETTIQGNKSYLFTYTLITSVDLAAPYTVAPQLTGVSGWTAQLIDEASDQPRSTPLQIAGGNNVSTVLKIRVTIPPSAVTGNTGTLMVSVSAANPGTKILPGSSSPIAITIGNPPPSPETRARITLRGSVVNGRVQIPRNAPGSVPFNLITSEGSETSYMVAGAFRTPGAGSVTNFSPPGVTTASAGTFAMTCVVHGGASAVNTDLILTITRGNAINVQYWVPVSIT